MSRLARELAEQLAHDEGNWKANAAEVRRLRLKVAELRAEVRRQRSELGEAHDLLAEWGVYQHEHAGQALTLAQGLRRMRANLGLSLREATAASVAVSYRDLLRRVAIVCKREGDVVGEYARGLRALLDDWKRTSTAVATELEHRELGFMARAEDLWTCAHLARGLLGPDPELEEHARRSL